MAFYQASSSSCKTIYFLAIPTTRLVAASAPGAQARDILRLCWVSRRLRDSIAKQAQVRPRAYFSRKKIYGFNLQAISNWSGRPI